MGRRRDHKKRTTISHDPFGRKIIETEYVPTGCGMPSLISVGFILFLFLASRGC